MSLHQQLVDLLEEAIYETPEHINGVWLSSAKFRKLELLLNKLETLEHKANLLEKSSNELFEDQQKLAGQIISKLLDI